MAEKVNITFQPAKKKVPKGQFLQGSRNWQKLKGYVDFFCLFMLLYDHRLFSFFFFLADVLFRDVYIGVPHKVIWLGGL
jgi:hypothetical protein